MPPWVQFVINSFFNSGRPWEANPQIWAALHQAHPTAPRAHFDVICRTYHDTYRLIDNFKSLREPQLKNWNNAQFFAELLAHNQNDPANLVLLHQNWARHLADLIKQRKGDGEGSIGMSV